jgi:hypothetical protein
MALWNRASGLGQDAGVFFSKPLLVDKLLVRGWGKQNLRQGWDTCVCFSRILTVNCRMRQAKELLNQLRETLVHFPVEVLIGKSFVKVRHRGVEKVIICLVCVCDCD